MWKECGSGDNIKYLVTDKAAGEYFATFRPMTPEEQDELRPGMIIREAVIERTLHPTALASNGDASVPTAYGLFCVKKRYSIVRRTYPNQMQCHPFYTHSGRGLRKIPPSKRHLYLAIGDGSSTSPPEFYQYENILTVQSNTLQGSTGYTAPRSKYSLFDVLGSYQVQYTTSVEIIKRLGKDHFDYFLGVRDSCHRK
jgi:hypothetical protein